MRKGNIKKVLDGLNVEMFAAGVSITDTGCCANSGCGQKTVGVSGCGAKRSVVSGCGKGSAASGCGGQTKVDSQRRF